MPLLPINGVRLATAPTGIRYKDRDDIVLFELCQDANSAVVLTTNQFCAAPVKVCKQHLGIVSPRYLLVNSGNANAGLGEKGLADARESCAALARVCRCDPHEVLPFSTGVIGTRLPVEKIIRSYPYLLDNLREDAWPAAARAIMTTDTVSKGLSEKIDADGHSVTITGIAKGAGMIRPNMATMLAFVATDLRINADLLRTLLATAVQRSFHCITVDGDTSTNDACTLTATGRAGVDLEGLSGSSRDEFIRVLHAVFLSLAQSIVRDAEGATRFISIKVEQADSTDMASAVAFTVAHSPLVKTAAFAGDPNWGRILAAAGRTEGYRLEIQKLTLLINGFPVVVNGEVADDYTEEKGVREMSKKEVEICLRLGLGESAANIWTTDLSYDYVKINAEYRT